MSWAPIGTETSAEMKERLEPERVESKSLTFCCWVGVVGGGGWGVRGGGSLVSF